MKSHTEYECDYCDFHSPYGGVVRDHERTCRKRPDKMWCMTLSVGPDAAVFDASIATGTRECLDSFAEETPIRMVGGGMFPPLSGEGKRLMYFRYYKRGEMDVKKARCALLEAAREEARKALDALDFEPETLEKVDESLKERFKEMEVKNVRIHEEENGGESSEGNQGDQDSR